MRRQDTRRMACFSRLEPHSAASCSIGFHIPFRDVLYSAAALTLLADYWPRCPPLGAFIVQGSGTGTMPIPLSINPPFELLLLGPFGTVQHIPGFIPRQCLRVAPSRTTSCFPPPFPP